MKKKQPKPLFWGFFRGLTPEAQAEARAFAAKIGKRITESTTVGFHAKSGKLRGLHTPDDGEK